MNEFVKKFGIFCSVAAIGILFCITGMRYIQPTLEDTSRQAAAVDETYDGVIIDKRIENASTNIFRASPTEYRLYVDVSYESSEGPKTVQKYFCVPESTYLAYSVGDYFNSHEFTLAD